MKRPTNLLFLTLFTLAACDGGGGGSCISGSTQVCDCTPTIQGIQTCGGGGTYGACICDGVDAGPVTSTDAGGGGTDAGGSTDPCACAWERIEGGADTIGWVLGVTSRGDLVYIERDDRNRELRIQSCAGSTSTFSPSDLGLPEDTSLGAQMLENEVLLFAPTGSEEVTLWDPSTESTVGSIVLRPGERVTSVDGRSHILTYYHEDLSPTSIYREYDSSGTQLHEIHLSNQFRLHEVLAEGWLVELNNDDQSQLLLDGVVTPSARPIPLLADNVFKAGTRLAEERRFVWQDDSLGFSEIDLAGETIWASTPIEYMDPGDPERASASCNVLMTDTNAWMGCWFHGDVYPLPGSPPARTTISLFRFDPESGEELERYEYETQTTSTLNCTGIFSQLVSDRCGGAYVVAPGPAYQTLACPPPATAISIHHDYVIDHYGADGVRD